MKNLFLKLLCIAISLVFCLFCFSCNSNEGDKNETNDDTENADQGESENAYRVTVLDYTGAPYRDVVVSLYSGDEMLKMTVVKEDGCAVFDFPDGDYTFTVMTTDNNPDAYYYDSSKCMLSASQKSVTVTLYNKAVLGEKVYTSHTGDNGRNAYVLSAGCSMAQLEGGMTYFLFYPTESGFYNFSSDTGEVGYYGNPLAAMDVNLADVNEDGSIDLNIKEGMLGGIYLLGVKSENSGAALVTLARTGNAQLSWEDRPWDTYTPEKMPEKFTLPEGTSLEDIDVTDGTVKVIFNESDGYFHYGSADGPIVYVRITTAGKYIAEFTEICNKTRFGAYIYDENGEVIRKESYNELIAEYAKLCDETSGVIPLDRNIEYVIKSVGEYWGWWRLGEGRYLFTDVAVVVSNAWLFACCYAK